MCRRSGDRSRSISTRAKGPAGDMWTGRLHQCKPFSSPDASNSAATIWPGPPGAPPAAWCVRASRFSTSTYSTRCTEASRSCTAAVRGVPEVNQKTHARPRREAACSAGDAEPAAKGSMWCGGSRDSLLGVPHKAAANSEGSEREKHSLAPPSPLVPGSPAASPVS